MQKGIALAEVAAILPIRLSDRLDGLKEHEILTAEEVRLRRGYPMTVLLPEGECPLGGPSVTEADLRQIVEQASQASAHTVLEQIKAGFITLKGGHRIGLCGTVSRRNGETTALRYISSVTIRVARAVEGQASDLVRQMMKGGIFSSTLILGPPGSGKTTLLREIIRTLSDGHGVPAHRVGVADERGEIAAMWQGEPQFRVGRQTDIVDGCPKAEGLNLLLRGMNPQILAADEITYPADVAAMINAAGCGVSLLATAHGGNLTDLQRRPVYRSMLKEGIFEKVIVLTLKNGRRSARVEAL